MGGLLLAGVAWWGPLLIVVGAVLGIVLSYFLLVFIGSPAPSRLARRIGYEPTTRTNYPRVNLAAIVVALSLVGLIVGLSIGLSAD